MMNVVIYARFSSHSQTEQSIEGQLKVCYEFAKRNDYNVIGEYIDRAISGKDAEKRPDFQRMIADSAKRQFNAILVYQLDRFSRNRYDSAIYKAKLRKYGVRVLSAKENISDDTSGVLMESVLEGMAEYYSVELAQKIRRGMQINAEKCLAVGGMKILGYKIQEKKYAIDTDEAPIVKKIFQMYIEGSKMAEIIRYLNNNDEKIDEISKRVCKLSEKESNTDTLKRLKKLIKENEQATANLIKSLETGKAVDIISAQIEKRQIEKQNLEAELAKEKILNPKLEFAQVKFFFDRFKNGNMNDMKFCQYMVDTFINRVFLFKEKLLILCNACRVYIPLDFSHPEGSYWVNLVEARGIEPLSEINISKTSTSVAFDLNSLEKSSKADFISN